MLAKLTSKNQLTLPKDIVSAFPGVSYFEVSERSGHIVLSPVRLNEGDAVRRKLRELGTHARPRLPHVPPVGGRTGGAIPAPIVRPASMRRRLRATRPSPEPV